MRVIPHVNALPKPRVTRRRRRIRGFSRTRGRVLQWVAAPRAHRCRAAADLRYRLPSSRTPLWVCLNIPLSSPNSRQGTQLEVVLPTSKQLAAGACCYCFPLPSASGMRLKHTDPPCSPTKPSHDELYPQFRQVSLPSCRARLSDSSSSSPGQAPQSRPFRWFARPSACSTSWTRPPTRASTSRPSRRRSTRCRHAAGAKPCTVNLVSSFRPLKGPYSQRLSLEAPRQSPRFQCWRQLRMLFCEGCIGTLPRTNSVVLSATQHCLRDDLCATFARLLSAVSFMWVTEGVCCRRRQ